MKKVIKILSTLAIALIFGCLSLYLYRYWKQEKNPLTAALRKSRNETFIRLSKGFVRYKMNNPDAKETIVFLGGAGVGIEVWEKVADRLAQRGFRTLTFDFYGRGFSDRVEGVYTSQLFTGQTKELLDSLKISGKINLASFSMGAIVGIDYALQNASTIKSFIFVDPAAMNSGLKWYLKNKYLADFLITVYWMPKSIKSQMSEFYAKKGFDAYRKALVEQKEIAGYKQAILSLWRNVLSVDKSGDIQILGKLPFPKLLIWGKNDTRALFPSSKKYISKLPGVSFKPIDYCGHPAPYEKPEEVARYIGAFLLGN